MENEKIGPALALLADVEALKIAVSAIVKLLPEDMLEDIRALATSHCELEQQLMQATLSPDVQIDRVRWALDALLLVDAQTPPRSP